MAHNLYKDSEYAIENKSKFRMYILSELQELLTQLNLEEEAWI